MRAMRRFFKRLGSWRTAQKDEERLRFEIEAHLALQTAENIRAGLTPLEARRQAVLKFGALDAVKESYRDQRTLPLWKPSSRIHDMHFVVCAWLLHSPSPPR